VGFDSWVGLVAGGSQGFQVPEGGLGVLFVFDLDKLTGEGAVQVREGWFVSLFAVSV
jgi:hypothetical protein